MNFEEAVSVCFSKYADFDGRGSRAECWGFLGFAALACTAAALVHGKLALLIVALFALPALAAAARRLRDTGLSAWWLLIALLPVVGLLALLALLARRARA